MNYFTLFVFVYALFLFVGGFFLRTLGRDQDERKFYSSIWLVSGFFGILATLGQ